MAASSRRLIWCGAALTLVLLPLTWGHGYLWDPPARGTMWRKGYNTPINYEDNEMFCGGFAYQWNEHNGRCGVCGDKYGDPQPRDHEGGGKYATGKITATYIRGSQITVTVKITAHHKGWFEFRLCPWNNPNVPATQECLDRYLLPLAGGEGTRYDVTTPSHQYYVDLVLPNNVTCSQCVLQWKYNTGNSWGTDRETKQSCIGCGDQEQFYGCADVSITDADGSVNPHTEPPSLGTDHPTEGEEGSVFVCHAIGPFAGNPGMDEWCQSDCQVGSCEGSHICQCGWEFPDLTSSPRTTSTTTPVHTPPPTQSTTTWSSQIHCRGTGAYVNQAGIDDWCVQNCARGNCPPTHCTCDSVDANVGNDAQSGGGNGWSNGQGGGGNGWSNGQRGGGNGWSNGQGGGGNGWNGAQGGRGNSQGGTDPLWQDDPSPPVVGQLECEGVGLFTGSLSIAGWCNRNCNVGYCPKSHCRCIENGSGDVPICRAVGPWTGNPNMDNWCISNCNSGYCPSSHCICN